jgi:rRNA small subunit pseudouridine methyltransferase Nep1
MHSSRPPNAQQRKRARNEAEPEGDQWRSRDVVVILERAGLWLGRDGLVDAYDRTPSVELTNESLKDIRPDIVHQCLLALFDSDIAFRNRLRVYISTVKDKVIEVHPTLRPPRTYGRFKGLMEALLRDGVVQAADGLTLMRTLPGTIAPVIPHGADVIGLSCSSTAPIVSASALAEQAAKTPVPDTLQGGQKNVLAFYVVCCTDDADASCVPYVTKEVTMCAYPMSSHVMCSRICEGFARLHGPVQTSPQQALPERGGAIAPAPSANHASSGGEKGPRPVVPLITPRRVDQGGYRATTASTRQGPPLAMRRGR